MINISYIYLQLNHAHKTSKGENRNINASTSFIAEMIRRKANSLFGRTLFTGKLLQIII